MAHPILKGRARFLKTIQRSECIQALTAKPEIAITQSGLAHRSRHPKQARGCRKSGQSATRSSALSATLSVRKMKSLGFKCSLEDRSRKNFICPMWNQA